MYITLNRSNCVGFGVILSHVKCAFFGLELLALAKHSPQELMLQ